LVKVASFNVNSIRARLGLVLDWLAKNKPDILCVQETKVQDADFPKGWFESLGYHCTFRGQKSYNGVAIFSLHKPSAVKFGFDDEPKDGARLIKADFGSITVVNSYVPQGDKPGSEKFRYKLRWFERLLEYFESNFDPGDAVLWLGDLNIAPERIDVYDPDALWGHVCFHPKVQDRLGRIMDWGFVDIFRKHCRAAGQYTFWDYRLRGSVERNLGWRLDHIMATKVLALRSLDCYIDKSPRLLQRPSDHTPVVAEFDW